MTDSVRRSSSSRLLNDSSRLHRLSLSAIKCVFTQVRNWWKVLAYCIQLYYIFSFAHASNWNWDIWPKKLPLASGIILPLPVHTILFNEYCWKCFLPIFHAYPAEKLFRKKNGELSVIGRLAAGACAGMTSTFVTYPLDVLRLRLAVEPGCISMSQVALNMLREEGMASFYSGLGPSLLGIAPYIAVNFCIFDLVKKSLPEKYQKRTETSLATALVSATLATLMCYPLDTVRRQMQMKGSPYNTVFDAFPGILERDGFLGLYRGFVPNALKNLPNSSIRLTAFDTVKGLIKTGQKELQNIMEENRDKLVS